MTMDNALETAITDALASFGATEAQQSDGALVLASLVTLDPAGTGALIVKESGLPLDKAWLTKAKPHLIPGQADTTLSDRAFLDGSLAARGVLVKSLGEARATEIARSYGLRSLGDTRKGERPNADGKPIKSKNPWHKSSFSILEQGKLVKSIGEKAAGEIAASVGCRLGSTKPNLNY
jgi:hypothetical protein